MFRYVVLINTPSRVYHKPVKEWTARRALSQVQAQELAAGSSFNALLAVRTPFWQFDQDEACALIVNGEYVTGAAETLIRTFNAWSHIQ